MKWLAVCPSVDLSGKPKGTSGCLRQLWKEGKVMGHKRVLEPALERREGYGAQADACANFGKKGRLWGTSGCLRQLWKEGKVMGHKRMLAPALD